MNESNQFAHSLKHIANMTHIPLPLPIYVLLLPQPRHLSLHRVQLCTRRVPSWVLARNLHRSRRPKCPWCSLRRLGRPHDHCPDLSAVYIGAFGLKYILVCVSGYIHFFLQLSKALVVRCFRFLSHRIVMENFHTSDVLVIRCFVSLLRQITQHWAVFNDMSTICHHILQNTQCFYKTNGEPTKQGKRGRGQFQSSSSLTCRYC